MIKRFNKFMWLAICSSIVFAIVGILLVCFPEVSVKVISYVIALSLITCGIVLISDYKGSILLIELSLSLKKVGYSAWVATIILAIITILCGLLIIINPQSGTLALTTFFGILLIVYSVSDIIDLFIFKNNVNDIVKLIKE